MASMQTQTHGGGGVGGGGGGGGEGLLLVRSGGVVLFRSQTQLSWPIYPPEVVVEGWMS